MRILWLSAAIILIDQVTKLVVYLNMYRNQSIPLVGDWLKFTFTENPGMAFGMTFGPRGMVAVLAIIATVLIIAYMWSVRNGYGPYLLSLALILGGALGNIIDRVFYGVIFGYGGLFMGKVVDFIHVDLWRGTLSDLIPFIGGSDFYFALFPIWNVADMAIVGGVAGILVFQGRFHESRMEQGTAASEETSDVEVVPAAEEQDGQRVSPAAPGSASTPPVSARPGE